MPCKRDGPPKRGKLFQLIIGKQPRLLAEFLSTSAISDARNKAFCHDISCRCGSAHFSIFGCRPDDASAEEGMVLLAPIRLRCASCSAEHLLFDPNMHGYDGELGQATPTACCDPVASLSCGACSGRRFRTSIDLIYAIQDKELADWPELRDRPEDFFTSISVWVACSGCGVQTDICMYECA